MSTRAAHLRALRGRGAVPSRGGERRTCGGRADRHRLEPLALDGEVARITLDVLGCEIRVRTVSWRLLNLVLGAVRRFGGQAADITFRLTVVPNRTAALAALEVLGVGRDSGGGRFAHSRILHS